MKKILNFTGASKIFFAVSLSIFLIGIICNVIFGVSLDIQFTGGTILQYNYVGNIDTSSMQNLIQTETSDRVSFNISENITVNEDGEYTSKDEVALYIHLYNHLPSNFITKPVRSGGTECVQ